MKRLRERLELRAQNLPWSAWVLLLFASGLAIRLYHLGSQCFWFDEAQTLSIAQLPLGEIYQRAYRPPLYHYLLHFWSLVAGRSEFWLRLPGALAGALVPPLLYLLGKHLYGKRIGLIAGALAVVSPALVAYSQELRMYSLLAVQFAALCGLATPLLEDDRPRGVVSLGYAVLAISALYTHYFALPFIAILAAWGAVAALLGGHRARLRRWTLLHAGAALAFVPWLLVITGGRGGTGDFTDATVSPILSEVPGVGAFLGRVWLFFGTGPVTSDWPPLRWLAWCLAGLTIVAIAATALRAALSLLRHSAGPAKPEVCDLALVWLLLAPLTLAGVMYHLRPGTVHPRHLTMLAIPLTLLLARAGDLLRSVRTRVARAPIALLGTAWWCLLGLLFLASTGLYLGDPRLQRADVRLLAEQIEARVAASDVVLLPYQDYAFDYYYQGAAKSYFLETRVGDEDLVAWAMPYLQGAQRAVLVQWVHAQSDSRSMLDWFLEANGHLVERFWVAERWVNVYDLDQDLALPEALARDVRFGPLRMSAVRFSPAPPSDERVPIALRWELDSETDTDWRVSLRLVDAGGMLLAADDRPILGEKAPVGTSLWRVGTVAHNYYLLPPSAGLPPVGYRVKVVVYSEEGPLQATSDGEPAGSVVDVGELVLAPPLQVTAPPALPEDTVTLDADLSKGLRIAGIAPLPDSIEAGQPLPVVIYWRAIAQLPAVEPDIALIDASGREIARDAGAPVYGGYPTDRWQVGQLVSDRRLLHPDPQAEPGTAEVIARLNGQSVLLGSIELTPSEREFYAPQPQVTLEATFGEWASLAGYDLEPELVAAGGPLALSLHWVARAASSTDAVVFVQLLTPDDRVIAQDDSAPAQGRWPTSGWVPGQVVTDRHALRFTDTEYRGKARLIAGMYDPNTLTRVLTADGHDHVVLATVTIH
ncbi:MAG: glycosyltransferase family 39 protein [Anaerolineae bacterium]|jgi:4-amino-4-deoxy-L-arabinose transferase-like glycosyltransferase|nr:hypothetical protein [Chloroflexota bacterium]